MDYYGKDYRSFRRELGLPKPESYDLSEILYTRRYYVTKRLFWGLIKYRVPVREVITRYDLKEERER